jgi:hypothetical protein
LDTAPKKRVISLWLGIVMLKKRIKDNYRLFNVSPHHLIFSFLLISFFFMPQWCSKSTSSAMIDSIELGRVKTKNTGSKIIIISSSHD